MLGYKIIKKGVIDRIKPLGVPIIASEIRSGFSKPAFFVQLMPIGEETNHSITENIVTINIHYFSEDKTDLDNLNMLDKLRKLFTNKLIAGDRNLTLYNKRYDLDDNVLQFRFDLRYTEYIADYNNSIVLPDGEIPPWEGSKPGDIINPDIDPDTGEDTSYEKMKELIIENEVIVDGTTTN